MAEDQGREGPKRAYNSPKRAQQAYATRRRILAAARTLFARLGYGGTTVEAVAAEADVAVQTVYQAFGSKPELLKAQLDDIDEAGGLAELRAVLEAAASAREQARAIARFRRRLLAQAADLVEAAETAGPAEPELWRLAQAGFERHRQGVRGVVRRWAATGALRPGLGEAEAVAILSTLIGHQAYRSFKRDWGWTDDRYEAWIADAITRLVLAPEA